MICELEKSYIRRARRFANAFRFFDGFTDISVGNDGMMYQVTLSFVTVTHIAGKSVRIPIFSGLYSPAFGLNTERYGTEYLSLFSPNAGKYVPEKLRTRTHFTQ